MLRLEDVARELLKINLYISASTLIWHFYHKHHSLVSQCLKLAILPASLILLSYLATGEFRYKGYSKNLILAYGLLVSVIMLFEHHKEVVTSACSIYIKCILLIYTAAQLIALLVYSLPYGTTTNPHFLAIYSAICFLISIFYLFKTKTNTRYLYLFNSLITLAIVLYTSSRPTWIGLILSAGFCIHHVSKKNLLKFIAIFIGLQALLLSINPFNYRNLLYELIKHITTEERTVIWADTWVMQKTSEPLNWVMGHGISSFYKDFQPFSRIHHIQDIKSPHNLLLEVLYTSGVVGILLVGLMYFFLYRHWLSTRTQYIQHSKLSTLILMIMTTSLMLNGLNFPFCSSSNIYLTAMITGLLVIVKSDKPNSNKN